MLTFARPRASRRTRAQLLALEKEGIFTAAAPGKWEGKAGTHVPSAAKGDDGAVVVNIKVRTHSLTRSLTHSLAHSLTHSLTLSRAHARKAYPLDHPSEIKEIFPETEFPETEFFIPPRVAYYASRDIKVRGGAPAVRPFLLFQSPLGARALFRAAPDSRFVARASRPATRRARS